MVRTPHAWLGRLSAVMATVMVAGDVLAQSCRAREPTPSASLGPHDFSAAPPDGRLWWEGAEGEPLSLELRVIDTCGAPVADALVRVLHAGPDGEHHPDRWRAHLRTDRRGMLRLITAVPGHAGWMARHIHVLVDHPRYRELVTRLYIPDEPERGQHEFGPLGLVLERFEVSQRRGWASGFELVLEPRS